MIFSKLINRNEFYSRKDRLILLIYAKRTTELGNLGINGSLLCRKLKKKLPGQVAIQGAHYGAVSGCVSLFFGGSTSATQEVVEFVKEAAKRNPKPKIFLSGMWSLAV